MFAAELHRRRKVINHPPGALSIGEIVKPQAHAVVADSLGYGEFSIESVVVKVAPDFVEIFPASGNVIDAANPVPISLRYFARG